MSRVAIAFSTCDRVELTKRSIEPLLHQRDKFTLFWNDGSKTDEGKNFCEDYVNDRDSTSMICSPGVLGGSGPAIVFALTLMLKQIDYDHLSGYAFDYIGLVENDVLLHDGWFDDMMALFKRGQDEYLEVGAVSARSYEDRILMQRDGYAVMLNLGAGMIMFSRKAAELVLQNYRTVWTTENRLLFSQLSGIDIAKYWAFRGNENFLVADWNFDRVLASHGLASLALTPNRCEMLDQDIAPLGLKYATGDLSTLYGIAGGDQAFATYRDNLARIRSGELLPGVNHPFYFDGSAYTIFAHQVPQIGGKYRGNWFVRDFLGFGPFCWRAGKELGEWAYPETVIPVLGSCDLIVSGGIKGGSISVVDRQSGFNVDLDLPPEGDHGQVMQLAVPGACAYREVALTAKSPGVCFFGIRTKEKQPWLPHVKFDYSTLPPP